MWIPCDSSMVLGTVVDDERVAALKEVAQLQAGLEAANDSYNAQLRNKLAMDMSVQQLKSMKMAQGSSSDKKEMQETMKSLNEAHVMQDKATMSSLMALVKSRMEFEQKYVQLMKDRAQTKIGTNVESPLKFNESELLSLPIGADSMNMDVQYFRCEGGAQGSFAHVSQVASHCASNYTSKKVGGGGKVEMEVEQHMNSQVENNNLVGTLVITANSTHKMAKMYDAKYDATKLLRAWNAKVEGEQIDLPGNIDGHYEEWIAQKDVSAGQNEDEIAEEPKIAVLTGQTYGSTFIGFVHFLKKKTTRSFQRVRKMAINVAHEASVKLSAASMTGSWGLDASAADEIKHLISSNTISSHVSVQTYGIIPSIASQGVETSLKKFTEFSPDATDKKLSMLASKKNSNGGTDTFSKQRQNAIRAGQIKGIERAKISAVLSGIAEGDKSNNQVLNMNSLMLAFDDYIKNVRNAEGGAPLTFFVASLRKADIIGAWMQEFRPDLYERATMGTKFKPIKKKAKKDGKDSDTESESEEESPSEDESETEEESD